MTDQENMARFIMMRSQGWSYNRIAVARGVSPRQKITAEIGPAAFAEATRAIPETERIRGEQKWST